MRTAGDFEIHLRENQGILILDLKGGGRLTAGHSESILRTTIGEAASSGKANVIVNLTETAGIDEDGIGALAISSAILLQAGGNLRVVDLSPARVGAVVLMGLEATLDVFTDEQDAVNSFFPGRAIHHFDLLEFVRENEY